MQVTCVELMTMSGI